MKLTQDGNDGSLIGENGMLDCDVFDENHEYVEPHDNAPPDWILAGLRERHGATGLAIASNHEMSKGVLSDVAIVFRRDDRQVVSAFLDPEYSALLAVSLMKRVHPAMLIQVMSLVVEQGMDVQNDQFHYDIIKVPGSLAEMPEGDGGEKE